MSRFRKLKKNVEGILLSENWESFINVILPEQNIKEYIGPFFSMLLNPCEKVRWRAVVGLGAAVSYLADTDTERARVVMRRFLWHLSEESGNLGWGIPESMAEAMARHPQLAREYHKNLTSYIKQPANTLGDDNYLEHAPLRLAVYWGICRLAQVYPDYITPALPELFWGLETEKNAVATGLICITLGHIKMKEAVAKLALVVDNKEEITLFFHGRPKQYIVGELARQSIALLRQG